MSWMSTSPTVPSPTALRLLSSAIFAILVPAAAASTALAAPVAVPVAAPIAASTAASTAASAHRGAERRTDRAADSLFPEVGTDAYDVSAYRIDLTYRRDGTITATTTISATATGPLTRVPLDFEGLAVDAVTLDGRGVAWARAGTRLTLRPVDTVRGGFTVKVRYHGRPVTHIDPDGAQDGWVPTPDGATVVSEPVGAMTWFPVNNTPADKARFTVAVTVPRDLEVAGNGDLVSRVDRRARTTWTWHDPAPMAPYLAMVSIGEYDVYRTSMTSADGRTIPIWNFVDPALGAQAATRALVPRAIAFGEKHFGPYPFSSAGIVLKNIGVGFALETQTRPFFDGTTDESTLVHEFAHQWYGDSVSPADWGDIWLNEGFAQYAEWWYAESRGSSTRAAAAHRTYARYAVTDGFWSPAPAALSDPADLFSTQVYERGAMTLEAVRQRIGSADFATLMRTWATRHAGGSTSTEEFLALAERISGRQLDPLADAWLYRAARPTRPPA